MTFAPGRGRRVPTNQEALSVELVSGFLMIIAIAAVSLYVRSIITHPQIVRAVQGPEYEGLGAEIQLVEPRPNIENQERYYIDEVAADSPAAEAGFQQGDLLVTVGREELDPAALGEDGLATVMSGALTRSIEQERSTVSVEVYRDGERVQLDLPVAGEDGAFEVELPVSGDLAPLGLDVNYLEADDLTPYYGIFPEDGGPSEEIPQGAKLLAIDGNEITTDIPLGLVQALARDRDVPVDEEDFEIVLDYEFQREGSSRITTVNDRRIIKEVPPTLFVAFIDNFGFAIPLLIVGLAYMFIRVGNGLRRYDISAARWALVIYLWLGIGLIVAGIRDFWLKGKGGSFITENPFDLGDAVTGILPYLVAVIPIAIAYWWLSNVMKSIFAGEETLTVRNTRFAWTLLVPTLAILVLVAARPLEQTFIKSLTDDIFGSTKPARFVGLDNYQNLIDFRPTIVDCRIDEETGECARARGTKAAIQWERSDYELRAGADRYREAVTVQLPWSDTKGLKIVAKDPEFINSFINTIRFTVSSVVLELILGMIIALVVNSQFAGRGLMRAAMLVPWAIPTVVGATLWQVMLRSDGTGILNKFLVDLGLLAENRPWLIDTGPWMNSIVAVDVWKTSPFMALLILAGLQTIPGDIYEAAAVDGAGRIRQFFQITLPLLRPTIAVALIFRTLDSLRVFDVFQVLLDPTRPSMATYNYSTMVDGQREVGYASAVGVLIFIFILIFTVMYVRFVGIEQE